MTLTGKKLIVLSFSVLLAGCAGASVSNQAQYAPSNGNRPTQIVVYPFATEVSDVSLNQGFIQRTYSNLSGEDEDAKQQQLAHDTSQNVCLEVVTALTQKGYQAICQQRGVPVNTPNPLYVDGLFTDISEGNRLKRLVVGFGAGASTLDTSVYVYQETPGDGQQQVLSFNTHADSGKMPGVIATGPAGAAAGGSAAVATMGANVAMGGVKTYRSSSGFLGDETADQIVQELEKYFSQQGWGV